MFRLARSSQFKCPVLEDKFKLSVQAPLKPPIKV